MSGAPPPRIAWLSADDPPERFPDIERACREPDGLLAAGGDLSGARLLYAYRHGIFPWYEDGQPILWWSPDPRCILRPREFHVARRLQRWLRDCPYSVRFNSDFGAVVEGCAGRRFGQQGTWITAEMAAAYADLHRAGWAHSVEVWHEDRLLGGLYGLAIGRAFFGESMFSRATNASKIAMLALCRHMAGRGMNLLDCQVISPHLLTLGAVAVPRSEFRVLLAAACEPPTAARDWPADALPARALAAA